MSSAPGKGLGQRDSVQDAGRAAVHPAGGPLPPLLVPAALHLCQRVTLTERHTGQVRHSWPQQHGCPAPVRQVHLAGHRADPSRPAADAEMQMKAWARVEGDGVKGDVEDDRVLPGALAGWERKRLRDQLGALVARAAGDGAEIEPTGGMLVRTEGQDTSCQPVGAEWELVREGCCRSPSPPSGLVAMASEGILLSC